MLGVKCRTHSIVVEQVLGKDQAQVRFSPGAPGITRLVKTGLFIKVAGLWLSPILSISKSAVFRTLSDFFLKTKPSSVVFSVILKYNTR